MALQVRILDSPEETEAVRLLRARVFVDEQGVPPEIEVDEFDDIAVHAVASQFGVIVGTGRLILDTPYHARIGRMAVEASQRRSGVGSAILAFLENEARSRGIKQVSLHAQNYVQNFYARYGYLTHGEIFLEAGILHIEMRKYIV
jgi:predicted GNAT family N-acyltransferase